MVDLGSISGWVKPKTITIIIHSFLLDVQQLKGQGETFTVCSRWRLGRWQLDSKTGKSLRYLLTEATWWIKCNYNYDSSRNLLILTFALYWRKMGGSLIMRVFSIVIAQNNWKKFALNMFQSRCFLQTPLQVILLDIFSRKRYFPQAYVSITLLSI